MTGKKNENSDSKSPGRPKQWWKVSTEIR